MDEYELQGRCIHCFLCDADLDIRIDKNGKPYVICSDCGMQIFFRGEGGRKILIQKFEEYSLLNPFTGKGP